MRRAIKRDAVHREMFYFRKSLVPEGDEEEEEDPSVREEKGAAGSSKSLENEYTLMSINNILNGKVSQA